MEKSNLLPLMGDVHSDFAAIQARPSKVLIVDDLEDNLYAMQKTLAKLNCKVFTTTSGADALALTLRHEFAVILLDVQMPVMNGFETAKYLRDNEDTRNVPIIFVTAISKEQRHIAKGYGSGAVDYLFKPVEPDMLISKVNIFIEIDNQRRQLKHMLSVVSEVGHRYHMLLDSATEGILGVDREGMINFANPAALRMIGKDVSLVGRSLMAFFSPEDPHGTVPWVQSLFLESMANQERLRSSEGSLIGSNGAAFPAEYSFAPFSPEYGVTGGVLIFQDITPRRLVVDALVHVARHDELTNLPNRAFLLHTLELLVAKASRHERSLSILYLDLDGFKDVNDTLGHGAGDIVLKEFADRLRKIMRAGDMVARVGGDEFAVLVDDATSAADIEHIAAKAVCLCSEPFQLGEESRELSVSVGLVHFVKGKDAADLLAMADQAMYRAKSLGKNRYSL